jgi:hypothetical protein
LLFTPIFKPSVTEREWGNRRSRRRGWERRFYFRSLRFASLRSADGHTPSTHPPRAFSFPQENIRGYECSEDYRDHAVHGEEGGVQFREIVGLYQGMFVEQEQRDGDDARDGEFA